MKQVNLGPWVGMLKDLASRTVFYVSILTFINIAIATWNTTLRAFFFQYADWITFWMYLAFLLTLIALAMLLEYTLVVPSTYIFLNKQTYIHQNPIVSDLEYIKRMLWRLLMGKIIEVEGKKYWAGIHVCGTCSNKEEDMTCRQDGVKVKNLQEACGKLYLSFEDRGFEDVSKRSPVLEDTWKSQ